LKPGGKHSVSGSSGRAFWISRPPGTLLKISASYVHDEAQGLGGVKSVVKAKVVVIAV